MSPRALGLRGAVVLRTLFLLVVTVSLLRQGRVTVRLLSAIDQDDEAKASLLEIASIFNDAPSIEAAIGKLVEQPAQDAIPPETVVTMYYDNNETTTGMDRLADDLFGGKICERIIASSSSTPKNDTNSMDRALSPRQRSEKVVVRVQFHCRTLFEKSCFGTGNFISAIYALRMAARALESVQAVEFLCSDAHDEAAHLILPWLTGVFPTLPDRSSSASSSSSYHGQPPTLEQACRSYNDVPIGYALDDITWEMRRLAVALVGIPYAGHPSEAWAQEHLWITSHSHSHGNTAAMRYQLPNPQRGAAPLVPNVELDDAILHFRCGDLIFSNLSRFGFMKFGSYSKHLDANVTSIGIATQPLEAGPNVRSADIDMKKKPQRCRQVIEAFVDHLQQRFPHARIRLRNDPHESIALTYARMVMAKQVVIGISTFGVFPAVASFGRSYIREPDYRRAPNQWLLDPSFRQRAEQQQANGNRMMLIQELRLTGFDCRRLWGDDGSAVLDWLRSP
jgi:hypothetical protein